MKRIIAILLGVFYLLPTIGYSMDVHWCGKKVSAVSFSPFKSSPKCSVCSKPMGCCKTTHTVVKINDSQHGSAGIKVIPDKTSQHVIGPFCASYASLSIAKTFGYLQSHSPPIIRKQPDYLINSVFRI